MAAIAQIHTHTLVEWARKGWRSKQFIERDGKKTTQIILRMSEKRTKSKRKENRCIQMDKKVRRTQKNTAILYFVECEIYTNLFAFTLRSMDVFYGNDWCLSCFVFRFLFRLLEFHIILFCRVYMILYQYFTAFNIYLSVAFVDHKTPLKIKMATLPNTRKTMDLWHMAT